MSDLSPEARYAPIPHGKDVERVLAVHTVQRAVWVAPALAALMGVARGVDGAVAALIGVAIVAANFLLSGAVMSGSARISLALYHAAALFGFFLRLGLIMLTIVTVAWAFEIDKLSLGISVIVAYLALITWEAVAVARGGERELEWTS